MVSRNELDRTRGSKKPSIWTEYRELLVVIGEVASEI